MRSARRRASPRAWCARSAWCSIAREGFSYAIHEHLLVPLTDAPAPAPGDDADDARWTSRDAIAAWGVRADAVAVVDRGFAEARARGLLRTP